MKKILFLFFILFISPVFGVVYDTNITGACGVYENLYAKFTPNQYTCNSGYFLPANTDTCATCPSGFSCSGGTYTANDTKNSGLNSSGTITQNITNACAANFTRRLNAIFTLNQYTCNSGYFLPANTDTCAACPSGFSCAGGTYSFNEKRQSGLVSNGIKTQNAVKACAANSPHVLNAKFVLSQYTCSAGYYLPANRDGCVICPANSYCSGGTYTFNETDTQGIQSCPVEYPSSDAGASAQTDCYNTNCTTTQVPHATAFAGGLHYGGTNTCVPADSNSCDTGYSYVATSGNVLAHCDANTITITYGDGEESESCTYGETFTVPSTIPTKRGHVFTGWTFE